MTDSSRTNAKSQSRATYRLLELVPYPRAERAGHLRDGFGVPLHGAYERKVTGGYRSALINHGRVLHRYSYPVSLFDAPFSSDRHSFANLVHAVPGWWSVSADAERPLTDFPRSEYPHARVRGLWSDPIGVDLVIAGRKPCSWVVGSPAELADWTDRAHHHGLVIAGKGSFVDGLGRQRERAVVAADGPLATAEQARALADYYSGQLPWWPTLPACLRLADVSGRDLLGMDLCSPTNMPELVLTGYAFGYPPSTTAACLLGTHG